MHADTKAEYTEVETSYDPPPRGYNPPGKIQFRFRIAQWARVGMERAWGRAWPFRPRDERYWLGLLDGMINRSAAMNISMNKRLKLGWHDYVDSAECLLETF